MVKNRRRGIGRAMTRTIREMTKMGKMKLVTRMVLITCEGNYTATPSRHDSKQPVINKSFFALQIAQLPDSGTSRTNEAARRVVVLGA